jgi:hypothetical protein
LEVSVLAAQTQERIKIMKRHRFAAEVDNNQVTPVQDGRCDISL